MSVLSYILMDYLVMPILCSQDFQFFDPAHAQLQEREMAVHEACEFAHVKYDLTADQFVAAERDRGHVTGATRA